VTRDPDEGVDADGYLVTGASLDRVPPGYQPVIADCVAALTAYPELDGLYLYGSVATGQARPPDSDLDLLALWTSTVDGCFLKHYCVPLAGRDRRPELPRCRPSRALAAGFAGDLPAVLGSIVDRESDPVTATRKVARQLLLGAATIESVSHATWSTDRGTGVAMLSRHHPEWTDVAARALRSSAGLGSGDGVEQLLALGDWLQRHP
jgi:hypothetical protein